MTSAIDIEPMSPNLTWKLSELPSAPGLVPFGEPVSERFKAPEGYQASDALQAAVQVALMLGMPLLLTGEPGCGKTSVAGWLGWKLQLPRPLVFNVKSATVGRDLLYEFDELARFRDAQAGDTRPLVEYVRLNALGRAILLASNNPDEAYQAPEPKNIGSGVASHTTRRDLARYVGDDTVNAAFGQRQIVLIDELDKAPRDTPNDLLHEILEMRFLIRELDATIVGDPALRPVVVVTSNSEKSLPEPFLRRCVFHHIESPDAEARQKIVERRMHPFAVRGILFEQAMRLFERICTVVGRRPGTAELLAWLTALNDRLDREFAGDAVTSLRVLGEGTLGALAKTREDVERAEMELRALTFQAGATVEQGRATKRVG